MPFKVYKCKKCGCNAYRLKKKDNTIVNICFKTKESAVNFARNAIMFRDKKKSILRNDNWIVPI